MVWVMVDIGPTIVDIIPPIIVVMTVVILHQCTFNEGTARKRLQDHSPTIGTIAVTLKAIIHKSKSVLMVGYQLLRS